MIFSFSGVFMICKHIRSWTNLQSRFSPTVAFAIYLTSPTWQADDDTQVVKNWPSPDTYDIYELLDITVPDPKTTANKDLPLVAAPGQLNFKVLKGRGMAYSGESQVQTLSITTAHPKLQWKINATPPWLVVTPTSGRGNTQEKLQAVGQALRPGKFLGKIKVWAPDSVNDKVEIAAVFDLVIVED